MPSVFLLLLVLIICLLVSPSLSPLLSRTANSQGHFIKIMLSFPSDDDDLPAVSDAIGNLDDIRDRLSKPIQLPILKSEPVTEPFVKTSVLPPATATTSPGIAGFINRFKRTQLNPVERVKQAKWSSKLTPEQLAKIANSKPTLSVANDEDDDGILEVKQPGGNDAGGIFGSRTALLQRAHVPRVKRASIDKLNEVLDKRIRLKQDQEAKLRKPVAIQQDECLFDPTILRKEVDEDPESESEEEEIDPEIKFEETGLLLPLKKKIRALISDSESEKASEISAGEESDESEVAVKSENEDLIDTLADLDDEAEDGDERTERKEPRMKWKASDFFDEEAESDEEDSDDGDDDVDDAKLKNKKKKKPKTKSLDEQVDEKAIEDELSGFIAGEEEVANDENLYQVHQQLEQRDDEARLDALLRRFGNAAEGMAMSASRIEAKYKRKPVAQAQVVDTQGPSAFRMLIQEELCEAIKYSDHLCGQDDEVEEEEEEDTYVSSEAEVVAVDTREQFTIDLTEEITAIKRGKRISALQMDARVAERIQQTDQ